MLSVNYDKCHDIYICHGLRERVKYLRIERASLLDDERHDSSML